MCNPSRRMWAVRKILISWCQRDTSSTSGPHCVILYKLLAPSEKMRHLDWMLSRSSMVLFFLWNSYILPVKVRESGVTQSLWPHLFHHLNCIGELGLGLSCLCLIWFFNQGSDLPKFGMEGGYHLWPVTCDLWLQLKRACWKDSEHFAESQEAWRSQRGGGTWGPARTTTIMLPIWCPEDSTLPPWILDATLAPPCPWQRTSQQSTPEVQQLRPPPDSGMDSWLHLDPVSHKLPL